MALIKGLQYKGNITITRLCKRLTVDGLDMVTQAHQLGVMVGAHCVVLAPSGGARLLSVVYRHGRLDQARLVDDN